MTNSNRTVVVILSLLVVAAGSRALAQDWPQWRGPNRDGKAAGFKAPQKWPEALNQKWKVAVGQGDATPALAGDKLYVFSREETNEVVRCLEAGTGKEVWANKYPAPGFGGPDAAAHSGPRSSPVVAEGKVITLGVSGTLSCLDAKSGSVVWRKDDFPGAWPRFHTAMSPLITDDLCIAQLGKESAGAIVAYDLASGTQKWKWDAEGPAYASPVLLTVGGVRIVATLTARSIVGVAAKDGKLLWQAPFAPQGMAYNAATPIADGQTLIYCGQGRGARAVKFEKDGDTVAAKELWSNPDNSVQFNTPVLKNGLLFGLSKDGKFFCLNAETGKTAWADPTGGRGAYGSVVDAGSVLMGLTSKSQLTVFQPSDKEYTELASFKVADSATYSYPVLAGNRLFVKDQNSVILWVIE
jgi:outer membrane protein assembly factor BamB